MQWTVCRKIVFGQLVPAKYKSLKIEERSCASTALIHRWEEAAVASKICRARGVPVQAERSLRPKSLLRDFEEQRHVEPLHEEL